MREHGTPETRHSQTGPGPAHPGRHHRREARQGLQCQDPGQGEDCRREKLLVREVQDRTNYFCHLMKYCGLHGNVMWVTHNSQVNRGVKGEKQALQNPTPLKSGMFAIFCAVRGFSVRLFSNFLTEM